MILAIYPSINQPVNHADMTDLRGKNGKKDLQIIACQLLLTGLRKIGVF